MTRAQVPIRGWDTLHRVQSRLVNARIVGETVRPRPKPILWLPVDASTPLQDTERFDRIFLQSLINTGDHQLGDVVVATTSGYVDTGKSYSRLFVSRFGAALKATPVMMLDTDTDPKNFFPASRNCAEVLTLGDLVYVNTGITFMDALTDTDQGWRLFQCAFVGRTGESSLDELHDYQLFPLVYNSTKSLHIASETFVSPDKVDFVWNADGWQLCLDLGSGNAFPPSVFDMSLFMAVTSGWQSGAEITVEFLDNSLNVMGTTSPINRNTPLSAVVPNPTVAKAQKVWWVSPPVTVPQPPTNPSGLLPLDSPTLLLRREVFVNSDDILNSGLGVRAIRLSGYGFLGAGTLEFWPAVNASGSVPITLYAFGNTYYTISDGIPYLGVTAKSNVSAPVGVGLESDMRQASSVQKENLTAYPVPRNGFGLNLVLNLTSPPTPAIATKTLYFASADGNFRPVSPRVFADTSLVWSVYADDIRDVTLGRSLAWEGIAFPQVEAVTNSDNPQILCSCFWNGRLVMATSDGKLWLSDPANSFAFGGAGNGDILEVGRRIYQLIPRQNILYFVDSEGLNALSGVPGNWFITPIKEGRARPDGTSQRLALMADGVYDVAGREITLPIRAEIGSAQADYLEWGLTDRGVFGVVEARGTRERSLWELYDGHFTWHRFDPSRELAFHTAAYLPGQGLVVASAEGLHKLEGAYTDDWECHLEMEFPGKSFFKQIEIYGSGPCDLVVNNDPSTRKRLNMPDVTRQNLMVPQVQSDSAWLSLYGVETEGSEAVRVDRIFVTYDEIDTPESKGGIG